MKRRSKRKYDQHHDRYFKDTFQDRALAKEFLGIYLNKEIHQAVDWDTFTVYDTSFIGANGMQKYADVLYVAQIKAQPIDLLFMLNHERKPNKHLGIKIGEYSLGAMRRGLRQEPGRHMFVISYTYYNGVRSPYPHAYPYSYSQFLNFEAKNLMERLILHAQNLLDVSAYKHTDIGSHGTVGIAELFMKHVDNVDVGTWLVGNEALLESFEGSECLDRSWNYLADVNECEVKKLVNLFEESLPKSKEKMLSIRQQIKKEGIQEGINQGIQEGISQGRQEGERLGLRKIARQMLFQLHMGMDVIQRATGLSVEELEQLKEEGM